LRKVKLQKERLYREACPAREAQVTGHLKTSESRRIKMAAPTRPVRLTPGFEEMSMSDVEGVTSVTPPLK